MIELTSKSSNDISIWIVESGGSQPLSEYTSTLAFEQAREMEMQS